MLPTYRTEGEAFSIPKFELTPQDVDGFLDELHAFHHHCRAGFARSEPREHFFNSMVGQCSARKRTSIEPMALHVEGGNIRGMQRCMSDDVWDEDHMRQTYHGLVADEMGDPDGVLMFDESGFVKKGKDSVGVARQYCGTLGKVENRQGGVFAAYASRHGYALVDKRLFMPEPWFTEDYKDRRDKCNVPKDVTFHTKPQLAVEMLQAIRRENRLPFKYIVADGLYGNSPDFLDALDACVGVTALVSIPAETRCWLQRPLTTEKTFYVAAVVKPLFPFFPSLASFLEGLCHLVLISLLARVLVLRRPGMARRVRTSQSGGHPYHHPWLNPDAPGHMTSMCLAASLGVGT
jgi:hypothetical protein